MCQLWKSFKISFSKSDTFLKHLEIYKIYILQIKF